MHIKSNNSYLNEFWHPIKFDFEYANECRIEVSNFGRIRTFNKTSNGNIITGSMVNGYRILKLKFFKPREEEVQQQLDYLKKQSFLIAKKLKTLKLNNENELIISSTEEMYLQFKKDLSKKFANDLKSRTINYNCLIHRLVAQYFLQPATDDQKVVAHLDYNKLNNKASNLKWMSLKENYLHQTKSPYVIKEHNERSFKNKDDLKTAKLTVTKVMLLKKLLKQDKPIKQLMRLFKVTDTQIYRIKRGENWADIKAAE